MACSSWEDGRRPEKCEYKELKNFLFFLEDKTILSRWTQQITRRRDRKKKKWYKKGEKARR